MYVHLCGEYIKTKCAWFNVLSVLSGKVVCVCVCDFFSTYICMFICVVHRCVSVSVCLCVYLSVPVCLFVHACLLYF